MYDGKPYCVVLLEWEYANQVYTRIKSELEFAGFVVTFTAKSMRVSWFDGDEDDLIEAAING